MLMSPSSHTPDPVVMSRLIASSMLMELDRNENKHANTISVLNILRLLEMYRHDAFDKRQPLGILEADDFRDLNALQTGDAYVRLKGALATAHRAVYPQLQTAAEFVGQFATILSGFERDTDKTPEQVTAVRTFLTNFKQALTENAT